MFGLEMLLLLFLGSEAAYRVHIAQDLIETEVSQVQYDPRPSFRLFGYPHTPWRFDPNEGWVYTETWISGEVKDGAFDQFRVERPVNQYGTIGEIETLYENAEVKILVFGSSYTPVEITNLFQKRLSKKLDKTVCALTFTRGSTGLLAFMDMARVRAERFEPDMILIAFSTTCLRINRRAYVNHRSREHFWRFYMSVVYSDDVHPRTHVVHNTHPRTTVITDLATPQWGEEMLAARAAGDEKRLREDPVIRAMIEEYHDIQIEDATPLISRRFWLNRRPFLLSRLVGADPLVGIDILEKKFSGGDLGLKTNDYSADPSFLESIEYLNANNIPFYFVHIPNLPEAEAGTGIDYKSIGSGPAPWDDTIEKSIENVSGGEIIYLAEYYEPRALADPLKLFAGERDWHPSKAGQSAQADALVNLYMRQLR